MELVTRFPPSEVENLTVWRQILLRAFSKDVRLRVELDIINLAQKVLTDWENGGYRLGQVDKVVRATSNAGCIISVVIPYLEVFCPPINLSTYNRNTFHSLVFLECHAVGPLSRGSGLHSRWWRACAVHGAASHTAVVTNEPRPGDNINHINTQIWMLVTDVCLLQVQTHPVLQSTLQLLLSISAVLVKNIEHQVISQVCSF